MGVSIKTNTSNTTKRLKVKYSQSFLNNESNHKKAAVENVFGASKNDSNYI